MDTRYSTDRVRYRTMTTDELRAAFLVEKLFRPGELRLVYFETERAVVGSVVPTAVELTLEVGGELAAEYFCERRELGVLNIGGPGTVTVDGAAHSLDRLDCLYVGRGSREVSFASEDSAHPARLYLLSFPAHTSYPTRVIGPAETESVELGTQEDANRRTIHKCIHAGGLQSCQLVMGYTSLEAGSVWNTMPPHTHARRTEIYMYFDLEDGALMHLMGESEQTRHLIVRDGEAVMSPMWSIHSGAGTHRYTFCWGMGGENQEFTDMDDVFIGDLR
jgi:4-deoxy-L-threo-5-hexosulose-uronate ketol-isomerase